MTTPLQAQAVIEQIQKALDAQPTTWDYDSNQTPFYNDAEGNSRGGDNDGTYCLYGPDFFIDGERYEGPVLAERCAKKDARYIAECSPANVRILLAAIAAQEAEVGRLRIDAERWKTLLRALNSGHLRGAGHGRRFKLIETSPMSGEEEEVRDLVAAIDNALKANQGETK